MSQSKSVQELSVAGDEPSPEYIVKGCSYAPADMSSYSSTSFPVIDLSLFSKSSPAGDFEVNNALNTLKSALATTGCFQVIGHGMSNSFIDKLRGIAKEFYQLPEEEKQIYERAPNEIEGYGSDRIVSENQVLDWCYRLCLKVFPQHIRRPNLWPRYPPHFSEVLDEYALKMKSIMEILYKAMAKSLNVDENSFLKQFGEKSQMQVRFNYLPKCARPDLVLGIKPHTDKTGLTILLQDSIAEGLQVLVDDKWVRVPVLPYAFVVNVGDLMQIMSNGIFKSPMHRVVTNSERMRLSIVLFHEPEPDMEIGPVDALINDQTPRLYKNVTNYVSIHYKSYIQDITNEKVEAFLEHICSETDNPQIDNEISARECLDNIPHPKCLDAIVNTTGCVEAIDEAIFKHNLTFLGPACCDALIEVTDKCLSAIFPGFPAATLIVKDACFVMLKIHSFHHRFHHHHHHHDSEALSPSPSIAPPPSLPPLASSPSPSSLPKPLSLAPSPSLGKIRLDL